MDSDVTGEIKTSLLTTSGKISVAAAFVGPFYVVALLWLANTILPTADAEAFKKPILLCWAAIFSGSGLATMIASLMSRYGKVQTQREIAVKEVEATIATQTAAVVQENAVTNTEAVQPSPGMALLDDEIDFEPQGAVIVNRAEAG